MKILKLELQAFGPFKGYECIDFNMFESEKIFLISGNTGSGKTTIFDAISFALFGEMTGDFRKNTTSRCQHTKDKKVETYVRLTFSKDDKLYEVYRKPSYMVEGNKNPTLPKIEFKEITNGISKVLSIKIKEANELIEKLIGFTVAQFKQIVVLPQGQFIKILNVSSTEREKLLGALLNTELYDTLINKLSERSQALRDKISKAKDRADQELIAAEVNNITELEEKHKEALNKYNEASLINDSEGKRLLELNNEIKEIDENNKRLISLNEAKEELAKLKLDNSDIDEKRAYLKKLKSISQIKGSYDLLNARKNDLASVKANLANANNELKALEPEYLRKDEYEAELNKALESLRLNKERLNELASIKAKRLRINELTIIINKANSDREEAQNKHKYYSDLYNEYQENLADFKKRQEDTLLKITSYDTELEQRITTRYNAYQEKIKLDNKLKDIQDKVNEYESSLKASIETLSSLENERLLIEEAVKQNELLKFKDSLIEGKPCPLCGSIHHPSPVQSPASMSKTLAVIDKEILRAKDEINKLKANIEAQATISETLMSNPNYSLDMSLYDDVKNDYLELETRRAEHFNLIKDSKVIKNRLEEIEGSILRASKRLDETVACINKLALDIQAYNIEYDKLKQEVEDYLKGSDINALSNDLRAKINNDLGIKNTIDSKLKRINSEYTRLNTIITDLKARITSLGDEIKLYNERVNESLATLGIDITSFELELNNLYKLPILERAISEYDINSSTLGSKILTLEGLIKGNELTELAPLTEKRDILAQRVNELRSEVLRLNSAENSLREGIKRYNNAIIGVKDDMDLYQTVEFISKLSSGNLPGYKKISIKKFILMKLLDNILIFANHYLNLFSSNRYTLYREEGDSTSEKGLDLCVNDEQTGAMRSVSTLSGGESFITALALALGTSECIMSMNGGIKMENIFIDEGFGTLDGEMLDNAIEALITLAENGRLIGVISHVDAIKALIPTGLEVVKGKMGSEIKVNNQ